MKIEMYTMKGSRVKNVMRQAIFLLDLAVWLNSADAASL